MANPSLIIDASELLKEQIHNNPEYAWAWQSMLAMASHDEGLNHGAANRAAARFMYWKFDIDMSKHENYIGMFGINNPFDVLAN